jgi:hypothetical protein
MRNPSGTKIVTTGGCHTEVTVTVALRPSAVNARSIASPSRSGAGLPAR